MMKVRLFSILFCSLILSSCYNCVECTNCADPENNVDEICFSEANDYYSSRKEWRDDVKAYEKLYECDCN
jgi:hypothetical protein